MRIQVIFLQLVSAKGESKTCEAWSRPRGLNFACGTAMWADLVWLAFARGFESRLQVDGVHGFESHHGRLWLEQWSMSWIMCERHMGMGPVMRACLALDLLWGSFKAMVHRYASRYRCWMVVACYGLCVGHRGVESE